MCEAKNASVEIHPNVTYVSRSNVFIWVALNLTIRALYLQHFMSTHVHRIEIPYRVFPEWVGPRILLLESVDYFGTTDHFSGRKKKNNLNEQNFKVYWKIRIEDRGIRDRGSV